MTTAHCIVSPGVAPDFAAPMSALRQNWWQKWRHLFTGLLRSGPANRQDWATALPVLREMDSRMLDDVGAPQWARDTVQRQRDQRARAIEQILGGRYGCASPRLDPWHKP